jgi:hypothetical protein
MVAWFFALIRVRPRWRRRFTIVMQSKGIDRRDQSQEVER